MLIRERPEANYFFYLMPFVFCNLADENNNDIMSFIQFDIMMMLLPV